MQIGFNLVLKKLQGGEYPGNIDNQSPAEAFDQHCYMWNITATGRSM